MKLLELAKSELKGELLQGDMGVELGALVYDSRKISPGCLFVCMKGANFDSHELLPALPGKGVAAVVIDREVETLPEGLTVYRADNARASLAALSAAYFGFPARELLTIGVTGTKGKTTTTHMIRALLEAGGIPTGLIGTNGITVGKEHIATKNTTPESYEIQESFRKMADAGCKAVVMEVSSQGLMLHRTGSILFDYGIFMNIAPDHIGPNEHKSFEEYLFWKSQLFLQCKTGLINADDVHSLYIEKMATCEKLYRFGEKNPADFTLRNLSHTADPDFVGMRFDFAGAGREVADVKVGMPGRFNAENALAALSVAALSGVKDQVLRTGLKNIRVNGRMEIVKLHPYTVLVDYAHNAVSMEALLDALREYHPKRLVVVFGCGGNRAKERRTSMGEIGGKKADLSIITADNSRYEKVEDILADIRESIEKTGGAFIEIPDRREAIYYAVQKAEPGDMIAIIGKGHEDYQEICGVRTHFLDREVVEEALREMGE